MYMVLIVDVIKCYGMGFYFYVDDMQIYLLFNFIDVLQFKLLIEECI